MRHASLLLLLLLLLPLPGEEVFTDAEWTRARPATSAAVAGQSSGMAVAGVMLSLGAVVALAVGLGWLLRKVGMKRVLPGKGRHLEVLETVPVAFKRQVSLIRVGDQVVLVGLGEHEMHALATLPAAGVVPPVSAAPPPAPAPEVRPSGFQQTLARVLGRKDA